MLPNFKYHESFGNFLIEKIFVWELEHGKFIKRFGYKKVSSLYMLLSSPGQFTDFNDFKSSVVAVLRQCRLDYILNKDKNK